MGKSVFVSERSNVTLESTKLWMGNFRQGMLDAGFVQTTDTGQLDLDLVTLGSTSANTWYYMIFRFGDSLQNDFPIYFKVEFSSGRETGGNTSSYTLGILLTVGKGTDGAGNIQGVLVNKVSCGGGSLGNTSTEGVSFEHVCTTGEGYVGLWGYVNATHLLSAYDYPQAFSAGFVIERSRSWDGLPTGDGVMVACAPSCNANQYRSTLGVMEGVDCISPTTSAWEMQVYAINYATGLYNKGGSPATAPGLIQGSVLRTTTSLSSGAIGPVIPWDMIAPGLAPWRSCVIVSIPGGDMPGGVFQTKLCGQVGSFHPVQPSSSNSRFGIALGSNTTSRWFGAGIRWED